MYNKTKLVFFQGSKPLKKSIKSSQKILVWGSRWPLMNFETNGLKTKISVAYKTLEIEISTAYIILETNVLFFEGLLTPQNKVFLY